MQTMAASPSICRLSTGVTGIQRRSQCRAFTVSASSKRQVAKSATDAKSQSEVAVLDRRALLSAAGLLATAAVTPAAAWAEDDDGYTVAPNGLAWKDLKVGDGASPKAGDGIRCHYTGKLASNGAVFDSSYTRGRPLSFKIGVRQVIAGWDQGILGNDDIPPMKEGGKRALRIPAELGYGARGAGGVIPPNAVLLFAVELLPPRKR